MRRTRERNELSAGQTRPYITTAEPLSSARSPGRHTEALGMESPRMAPARAHYTHPAELADGPGPSPPRLRRRFGGSRAGNCKSGPVIVCPSTGREKAHHKGGADRGAETRGTRRSPYVVPLGLP